MNLSKTDVLSNRKGAFHWCLVAGIHYCVYVYYIPEKSIDRIRDDFDQTTKTDGDFMSRTFSGYLLSPVTRQQ